MQFANRSPSLGSTTSLCFDLFPFAALGIVEDLSSPLLGNRFDCGIERTLYQLPVDSRPDLIHFTSLYEVHQMDALSVGDSNNPSNLDKARVAELVDAPDLGSGAVRREGSTPSSGTKPVLKGVAKRPLPNAENDSRRLKDEQGQL